VGQAEADAAALLELKKMANVPSAPQLPENWSQAVRAKAAHAFREKPAGPRPAVGTQISQHRRRAVHHRSPDRRRMASTACDFKSHSQPMMCFDLPSVKEQAAAKLMASTSFPKLHWI
ncbi:unnamed protein product, partial [Polarella glacialis]